MCLAFVFSPLYAGVDVDSFRRKSHVALLVTDGIGRETVFSGRQITQGLRNVHRAAQVAASSNPSFQEVFHLVLVVLGGVERSLVTNAFTVYVPMIGVGLECVVLDSSGEISRMFFVHDGQLVICDGLLQLLGSFLHLFCRRIIVVIYGLVSRHVGVACFAGGF